jgi:hypothetical protein
MGFAPVQRVKRKKDAAELTPKCCFVAAEAIKREIRQVGEPEKAAGEFDSYDIGPAIDRPIKSLNCPPLQTFGMNFEQSGFHRAAVEPGNGCRVG